MTIISDKAVILGSLNKNEIERLTAFDLMHGNVVWQNQVDENISSAFSYNDEYIFVGFHSARVKAYEPTSGNLIWDARLDGSAVSKPRNIELMVATEAGLLVKSDLSTSTLLDTSTGEKIEANRIYLEPSKVYIGEDLVLSQPSISQVAAINRESGELAWQFNLENLYFQQTPIVNNDFVVLKAGPLPLEALGSIWVLNENSGETIWQSTENVGSNAAIYDNRLFFLTMDAKLHIVDLVSGQEISTISFTSGRLDDSYVMREFHVDAFENIVVIYFGDSAQLFALRLE